MSNAHIARWLKIFSPSWNMSVGISSDKHTPNSWRNRGCLSYQWWSMKSWLETIMMMRLTETSVPGLSSNHSWRTKIIWFPHYSTGKACDGTHMKSSFPSVRSSSLNLVVHSNDGALLGALRKIIIENESSLWWSNSFKIAVFKDSVLLHISQYRMWKRYEWAYI